MAHVALVGFVTVRLNFMKMINSKMQNIVIMFFVSDNFSTRIRRPLTASDLMKIFIYFLVFHVHL